MYLPKKVITCIPETDVENKRMYCLKGVYLSFFPPPFSQVFVFGNRKGKLRRKIFSFFSGYSTDLFHHYYTDFRGRQELDRYETDLLHKT